ncbi:RHS repeat protein, partial [Sphingomonas gilva]
MFLNGVTGNLLIGRQDEYLVGRGPDIGIVRTYNSLGVAADGAGDHWRQGTDRRVYGLTGVLNQAGSTVRRVSGDGSEIVYAWDGAKAAYVATDGAGAYDTLVQAGGVWTWTDGDTQVRERYAAYGTDSWRIIWQADTDGNVLSFTYLGDGKLDKVTTNDGGWVQYGWDASGNLEKLVTGYTDHADGDTAKTLTRTRYGYDAQNRLTSVTVDLSPGDNAVADGAVYTTTYGYHGATDLIATIGQTDGSHVAIGYDGSGRVTSLVQTVASGDTRVTGIVYGVGYTVVTDPAGNATRLDYDGAGNLTKVTAPPAAAGAAAQVVEFAYDADGDLVGVTDAAGETTVYAHDAWGNVVSQTDRLGHVVTRTYGARNELLTETRRGADAGSADAEHTTRYVYDGENHLRYAITAEGRVTEYRYENNGFHQHVIDYPEHLHDVSGLASDAAPTLAQMDAWRNGLADRSSTRVIRNFRDARGNLVEVDYYGIATAAGAASNADGYTRTYYVYDQAGRLLSRNNYTEAVETFVYDGLGRVVASTDVHGGTTSIVFDDAQTKTVVTTAGGYVATSTYNKAGELVSLVDSGPGVAGGETRYQYDKLGRVRVAIDPAGVTRYTLYDNAGRLTAEVSELGEVTEYRYDANDRLVATVRYATLASTANLAALGDPDTTLGIAALRPAGHAGDQWSWRVHDAEGRLAGTIGGDGGVVAYAYDQSGRLIATHAYANRLGAAQLSAYKATPPVTLTLPAADAAKDSVERSFYDKDGLLVGTLDGEGHLRRIVHDRAGQKVGETVFATATATNLRASGTFEALLASVGTSAADRSARYVYDGAGRLRYTLDALDQVTGYAYNVAGKVTQTTVYAGAVATGGDYTFDNVKALVASSGLAANPANRTSFMVYDAAGRLAYAIGGEGAVTGYSYDIMGRVTKTVAYAVPRATPSLPALSTMNNWANAYAGHAQNRVTRHYYTARGELAYTVDGEGYVTGGTFDEAGRTTATRRWDTAVAVTDATTIATLAGLVSGGGYSETRFVHDAAGRLVERVDGAGSGAGETGVRTRFVYLANGLVGEEILAYGASDQAVTAYSYDGMGRVLEVTRASGTAEAATTGYRYNAFGETIEVIDALGASSYSYHDRLGRVTHVRDAEDHVTETVYNAFGEAASVTRYANKATGGTSLTPAVTADAARDATSHLWYDKLGRATHVRDAEGYVTATSYTVFGEVARTTSHAAKATGTPSLTTPPAVAADAARDRTTYNYYDRLGRVTHVRDAEDHVTETLYTTFGEIAAVTRRADKTAALVTALPAVTADPDHDAATRFYYDRLGRAILTRDAEDAVTQTGYDAHGRVVLVVRRAIGAEGAASLMVTPLVQSDAGDRATIYEYDRRGLLVAETLPISSTLHDGEVQKDGFGYVIKVVNRYAYDLRGNRTQMIEAAGLDEERVTDYRYDMLDRLTATIGQAVEVLDAGDHAGTTTVRPATVIVYDAAGNVIETIETVADAAGTIDPADPDRARTLHYYDALGRRIAGIDALGTLSAFDYDASGDMVASRVYGTALASLPAAPGGAPPAPANPTDHRETIYAYDRLGRLTATSIAGVRTGVWNGSSYVVSASATLTTGFEHDAWGNVVRTTDAAGGMVFAWYDRLGRKTAEADQEKYLTTWAHDAEGNVTGERRHAIAATGALATAAPPSVASVAADRVTSFTYDRNGRRLTETRHGVEAWTIDPATGLLAAATGDSTVTYGYTVFGQLETRAEANGDTTSYSYDAGGRLVREERASFLGHDGVAVTPAIDYAYDGLGNLTRARQAGAGDAGERVTRNLYDAGGRLERTIDAAGGTFDYAYDAAGNQLARTWTRLASDGTPRHEGLLSSYDRLGRLTAQATAGRATPSAQWDKGVVQATRYNA